MFYHPERDIWVYIHGDDFVVETEEEELNWLWERLKERFEAKWLGRLGPGVGDKQELSILNRIVRWAERGIEMDSFCCRPG